MIWEFIHAPASGLLAWNTPCFKQQKVLHETWNARHPTRPKKIFESSRIRSDSNRWTKNISVRLCSSLRRFPADTFDLHVLLVFWVVISTNRRSCSGLKWRRTSDVNRKRLVSAHLNSTIVYVLRGGYQIFPCNDKQPAACCRRRAAHGCSDQTS